MSEAGRKYQELREEHDALLTVLNAILLAYGIGPDGRLRVVDNYVGQPRRPVAIEPVTDGFIAYLEPLPVQEDNDGLKGVPTVGVDRPVARANRRSRRAAERAARRGL